MMIGRARCFEQVIKMRSNFTLERFTAVVFLCARIEFAPNFAVVGIHRFEATLHLRLV